MINVQILFCVIVKSYIVCIVLDKLEFVYMWSSEIAQKSINVDAEIMGHV